MGHVRYFTCLKLFKYLKDIFLEVYMNLFLFISIM